MYRCQGSYCAPLGSELSRGEAILDRNPLGRESDIHGNEGMPRGRWWDGKFTTILEQFDSQDCIPRDSQCRHAERAAASLPQAPECARTPDTHSKRETSIEMAANSLVGCMYV